MALPWYCCSANLTEETTTLANYSYLGWSSPLSLPTTLANTPTTTSPVTIRSRLLPSKPAYQFWAKHHHQVARRPTDRSQRVSMSRRCLLSSGSDTVNVSSCDDPVQPLPEIKERGEETMCNMIDEYDNHKKRKLPSDDIPSPSHVPVASSADTAADGCVISEPTTEKQQPSEADRCLESLPVACLPVFRFPYETTVRRWMMDVVQTKYQAKPGMIWHRLFYNAVNMLDCVCWEHRHQDSQTLEPQLVDCLNPTMYHLFALGCLQKTVGSVHRRNYPAASSYAAVSEKDASTAASYHHHPCFPRQPHKRVLEQLDDWYRLVPDRQAQLKECCTFQVLAKLIASPTSYHVTEQCLQKLSKGSEGGLPLQRLQNDPTLHRAFVAAAYNILSLYLVHFVPPNDVPLEITATRRATALLYCLKRQIFRNIHDEEWKEEKPAFLFSRIQLTEENAQFVQVIQDHFSGKKIVPEGGLFSVLQRLISEAMSFQVTATTQPPC